MNPRIRIGILTPSSNTALEPLTTAIVAGLPDVSVHFARFTVTEIRHARRPKGAGRVSSSLVGFLDEHLEPRVHHGPEIHGAKLGRTLVPP